jgi:hypothetical protein
VRAGQMPLTYPKSQRKLFMHFAAMTTPKFKVNRVKTFLIAGASLIAATGAAIKYGDYAWEKNTRALRERLRAMQSPVLPTVVSFRELEGLPVPIQRYFRLALTDGQPMIAGARVRHRGTFDMGDVSSQWKSFTSDQEVVTRRRGFDWDARVAMMPGVSVHVHDAYIAGEGILHAAVLGLFSVVDMGGTPEIAQGELMRFVAESAWYPTALLPSQGVRWEEVDARSARANLTDGAISLAMVFIFNEHGLIESIRAESRGRTVGKETIPTPWQGRFWNYQQRDGMTVPFEGEVGWLLPEGAKPYWRGRIEYLAYHFAK